MRQGQDVTDVMIEAGGVSLRKAVKALGLARRGHAPELQASSVPNQDGIGAMVFVILLFGAVELALVDLALSVLWMRLLALALGLLGLCGLLSFVFALREYPHRVGQGALTIHYGACFELSVPMDLVSTVIERKAISDQKRTAAVTDGVLSVPVMGVTNLVVALDPPITVRLRKTGVAAVREIRIFAVDPGSGARLVRNGGPDGIDAEVTVGPPQSPRWARALRWAGPLVLLVEIALVATGMLDWRVAAGGFAVIEGTLAVLGIAAGAALVSQYRRCRAQGRSRTDSLSAAFFMLMPTPMAAMVRKELGFLRVLMLVVARRTEEQRPGDMPLGYGSRSRKALLSVALVLLAAGSTVLIGLASSTPWIVLGSILLYVALLTAAVGLASKVRPHVLRGGSLLMRWGLHQGLEVPLGSVGSIEVERPQRSRRRGGSAPDRFAVPAAGRQCVVLRLAVPIAVPTSFGRRRSAETILLPVDDASSAIPAIEAELEFGVGPLTTEGTAAPRSDIVTTAFGS